ncbi:MAG: ATP-binding protein [archaeon]
MELNWFRGAGPSISLRPLSKNLVVYGENGSGKSSFVDAIEYIIAEGRIEHLAHEYSGHKQILGTRNTHTPDAASSRIRLELEDDRTITAEILPQGEVTYRDP